MRIFADLPERQSDPPVLRIESPFGLFSFAARSTFASLRSTIARVVESVRRTIVVLSPKDVLNSAKRRRKTQKKNRCALLLEVGCCCFPTLADG